MKNQFYYMEDDGNSISVWKETDMGDELIEDVQVNFNYDDLDTVANKVLQKYGYIQENEIYFE